MRQSDKLFIILHRQFILSVFLFSATSLRNNKRVHFDTVAGNSLLETSLIHKTNTDLHLIKRTKYATLLKTIKTNIKPSIDTRYIRTAVGESWDRFVLRQILFNE